MPLGEKAGWETSNSKFCGVETDFSDDVPSLLSSNIDNGGFDFVLAPLMYEDSFLGKSNLDSRVSPTQWKTHVIGQVKSLTDLESEDGFLWVETETRRLKQQVACANHLSLRACLLPTPPPGGTSCANYARCVKQILQEKSEMELWLRIPLKKSRDEKDSWEIWNKVRLLCDHNSKLSVVLDVGSMLPSKESLERWFGEPVKAAILGTECFEPTANGDAFLLKTYGELVTRFFQHSVQIIISGTALHHPQKDSGKQTPHPYRYLDSVRDLFHKMEPLSEKERIEVGLRDCLHTPLQPLKYNLDARSYELLKRDSVKYIQYKRAIAKALKERFSNEKASELTTVLMVVGAGRGPLVMASIHAAEETGRKLKVYAVEKNPNAVIALRDLVQKRGWEGTVTVVSGDLRFWTAPERADILVSEMLGYFGDNDLSVRPDGGQRFLKPNGISIPSSYTSFIQPITSSKLYNDLKSLNSVSYFETAYAVKLHSVARLAPFLPLFSSGYCYKKLLFKLPSDMGSAMVHGFAGYVNVVLYDDVHLSTEPPTGWFPMFFPLMNPVEVQPNSPIEVHFWRCVDSKKIWYEWSLTSPTVSPIHNSFGSSYWIDL